MKDTFYLVAMTTKNGKTLYLKASDGYSNQFEWTFDLQEGMWFPTEYETEQFAKKYFKNFKNWFIKEYEFSM